MKFRALLTLSLAVLLLAIAQAPAPAQNSAETPDQLAARVQKAYLPINSYSAHYTRVSSYVAMGGGMPRLEKAAGRITWHRPLQLRLDQESPRREKVISNGTLAWWVRQDKKRVDLYAVETFASGLRAITDAIGGLARIDQHFKTAPPTPAEMKAAAGHKTLVLLPKVTRADIKRLVLWFDPTSLILAGFRMENLVGDVTAYHFSSVATNRKITADTFGYQPPADWNVVDHRPIRRD